MGELTKRNSGMARQTTLTADDLTRWVDQPSLAVPAPMRLMCQFFWIEWKAIARDELSFCSRVARYHRDHGLTIDDLKDVFAQMNEPERGARIKFASDFFAEFAGLVAAAVKSRKAAEETERRREKDAKEKAEAADPETVRKLLAGIGAPTRET